MDTAHFNVVTAAGIYKNGKMDFTQKLFESYYSGFIGLQPYTADEANKSKNFLYSLVEKKLIDHMTVSFFTKNDDKSKIKSLIKFGGADKISRGKALSLIHTKDKTTWDILTKRLRIGNQKYENSD